MMTDDGRPHPILEILSNHDDRRAPESARPLVEIAGPCDGIADVRRGPIEHPRRVRAVDDRLDAVRPRHLHDVAGRKHQRGRRSDLIEDEQPRSWRDGSLDRVDRILRATDRHGHLDLARHDPPTPSGHQQRLPDRVVALIEMKDLVARIEWNRLEHRVDPVRRVRDEPGVITIRPEEGRHAPSGFADRKDSGSPDAFDGIPLDRSP